MEKSPITTAKRITIESVAMVLLLSVAITCSAESAYLGLQPGRSTREEVERMLGAPVNQVSETLFEYTPQSTDTGKIYVQYRKTSPVAVRIEVLYKDSVTRSSLISFLKLLETADASGINEKGKFQECFDSGRDIVLTYESNNAGNGVSRVGYFTKDLFEDIKNKLKDAPGVAASSDTSLATTPSQKTPAAAVPTIQGPASIQQGNSYDGLMNQAWTSLQAGDYTQAIRISQQAIQLDSSQPKAYEILGMSYTYGFKDMTSGEPVMRSAIERGGSASFGATHDHDGLFTAYCQGVLSIIKTGFSFRSYDGTHMFQASRAEIQDARMNTFVGAQYSSFHIKINDNGAIKNYNFAPSSFSAPEANLILSLLPGR